MTLTQHLQKLKDNGYPQWNFNILRTQDDLLIVVTNVEEPENQKYLQNKLQEIKELFESVIHKKLEYVVSPTVHVSPMLTKGYTLTESL